MPSSAHPPLDWPDYKSNRLRHPSRPLIPAASGDGRPGPARARRGPDRRVDEGRPLRELLLADDAIPLTAARLDDLLDPGGNIGSAPALVDRALAAHDREGP